VWPGSDIAEVARRQSKPKWGGPNEEPTLIGLARAGAGAVTARTSPFAAVRANRRIDKAGRPEKLMSDIFREVDEDVRRDQAAQIWARYQNLFIGLAVLVVAATAGWRFYDHYRTKQAEEAGAKYEAALALARDGKAAEAEGAFEQIAKTGPKGYATLARLREAAEYSGSDPAAAVKAYDAIAADGTIDPLFQNLARLRAALLRLDEADEKEIETRLAPMTASDNPFRFSAREALALAALKHDDFDAAGRQLDAIVVDPQAPAPMRQRAEALLAVVRSSKRAK